MRRPRATRGATNLSRALWRVGCGLVLAAAILFGTLQSGARYFYCDALGLMGFDPCVSASDDTRPPCPRQGLERQTPDCCERMTLPSLPDGVRASEPTIAPASAVSLLPVTQTVAADTVVLAAGSHTRCAERCQRPPPTARDRRAQLMVFLT